MLVTKTLDLGNGCLIPIASLTFDQVEEMLVSPTPDNPKSQREQAWKEVLMGVNNAWCVGPDAPPPLVRADVLAKLEAAFPALEAVNKFSELRLAILELSGYEIKKKPVEDLPPVPLTTNQ